MADLLTAFGIAVVITTRDPDVRAMPAARHGREAGVMQRIA